MDRCTGFLDQTGILSRCCLLFIDTAELHTGDFVPTLECCHWISSLVLSYLWKSRSLERRHIVHKTEGLPVCRCLLGRGHTSQSLLQGVSSWMPKEEGPRSLLRFGSLPKEEDWSPHRGNHSGGSQYCWYSLVSSAAVNTGNPSLQGSCYGAPGRGRGRYL